MNKDFIPATKPIIGVGERTVVNGVLQSGMLAQDSEVAAFETEFADVLTAGRETTAVNSRTSALLCGLLAADTGIGDEVIVPPFTFTATVNSVALTRATPVFTDIGPRHFCLDPQAMVAAIAERIKAILSIHLYDHLANTTALGEIVRENGLTIFEGAAQAHGVTWSGQPMGTLGVFRASSPYPTKNMTSGEEGMITCGAPELARKCRLYRNQGMEKQYENEVVGYNLRMTNTHAVTGRGQLKELAGWTAKRHENAAFLLANPRGVKVSTIALKATHVFHQYTIHVADDRDGFVKALRGEYQIGSRVYYPIPNHWLPSLARFASGLDLPATETAVREVVSLPMYPSLDLEDLEWIVTAVSVLAGAGAQFRFSAGSREACRDLQLVSHES